MAVSFCATSSQLTMVTALPLGLILFVSDIIFSDPKFYSNFLARRYTEIKGDIRALSSTQQLVHSNLFCLF